MDAKRPRLFFRNVFELSDPKSPVEEIIKKSIDANINKMGLLVKNILTTKKREIDESKLAFSAVARENLTLKEGNGFLKIQLDECFKLLEEKDKIMDEGKKKIDEIGKMDKSEDEYKSLLAEFIGVEEQVNDQKNVIELLQQSEDQHETKLYGMEEDLNVKNREIKFLEQELRGQIRKKIRYAEKCKKEERAKISAFERLGEMEIELKQGKGMECNIKLQVENLHQETLKLRKAKKEHSVIIEQHQAMKEDPIIEKDAETHFKHEMVNKTSRLEEKVKQADSKLIEKQTEIDQLEFQIDDLETKLEHFINQDGEMEINREKLEKSQSETLRQIESLKSVMTNKEEIIDNLQKALDEQFQMAEVQNEQNTIYRQEYENNLEELRKCSLENLENFQEYLKKSQEQNLCKICLVEDVSTVFLPCGHLCSCSKCADPLMWRECPICRVRIEKKIKVYKS